MNDLDAVLYMTPNADFYRCLLAYSALGFSFQYSYSMACGCLK